MKKIFILFPIFLVLFTLTMSSCTKAKITTEKKHVSIKNIQNGDLIFVGALTEELSGAISRATKISDQTNFDHVGLIEKTTDSIFVLHAAPMGGSQREEIHHFYNAQTEKNNQIVIYRLKKEVQSTIPNAIVKAKTMLGKPYNWLYILNDDELYCSDFVERAFRDDQVFELIPMNFKNKETGIIDDFWVNFYRKKGKEVPQDEPGTNPNQLATSEKLIRIGALKL
ncbi:YiiX/YebB-like N1pC/P60 family cysteine hydrolase [Empedobacter stercoris]|uniref:YiiX/YebB-like N1pC/P60 family cysteine hydrolase n=1 Tax=Empedobacter stercoris TaxID=1628248 RepID=UPI0021AEBC8F|nr:YiiX/YebB-like N1pC/P60 family cysteine hydrolase [Empedobacter stercoris]UWX66771.1 YiiX/YebB-like N1pC/P60 family cysteine hydrolase [Empedobacter stercoris]